MSLTIAETKLLQTTHDTVGRVEEKLNIYAEKVDDLEEIINGNGGRDGLKTRVSNTGLIVKVVGMIVLGLLTASVGRLFELF